MNEEKKLEVIMGLIMNSGEAKSYAMEAIRSAKEFKFQEADNYLKEANNSLNIAHNSQTELLTQEASGEPVNISLLMVHGQDHLMTSLNFIDLAREVIDVYKEIYTLSN